jgi:DNA-binding CsgD family transcriptional regulator
MLFYLLLVIFAFSSALTAGGVMLSHRLRNRFETGFLTSVQYFQIFTYAFGFYGLWGSVLLRTFISSFVQTDLTERITGIMTFIGIPFLVASWYMLIKAAIEMSGRSTRRSFIIFFLLFNLVGLALLGGGIYQYPDIEVRILLKYYYISFNSLFFLLSAILILMDGKKQSLSFSDRLWVAVGFVIVAVVQGVFLEFYRENHYIGAIFILFYFLGNAFLPIFLTYFADLSMMVTEGGKGNMSFKSFCRKYEISPREAEIVLEICKGLTNQDIADKLFISLQTVKDHTHRIYLKTFVKSRTQLANLIKEKTDL